MSGPRCAGEPPVAGDVLGGTYELRRVLGSGAMGVVFEAHDAELMRTVAVKYPRTREAALRLVDEGRALATLRHSSLPAVYALAWDEGETPYLVLERILGLDLGKHLTVRRDHGARFPIAEAVDVLAAIADALCAVHACSIAHLDIKPENVLVCGARVALIDFGLMQPELLSGPSDTAVGSPTFMAPEVIRGAVTRGMASRADIYSLGVLAYEVLAGEVPFDAPTVDAILDLHLDAPPPDLSERRPEVPPALAALVRAMMDKDPERRPAADEILFRLRAIRREIDEAERPTVLVVDDDDALAELVEAWLEQWLPDARILRAADGREALDLIAEHAIGLMLMDVEMPRMTGVELVMYLQGSQRLRPPSIIAMSGRADAADVSLLEHLGVRHFVPKGADLERALERLVSAFAGSS